MIDTGAIPHSYYNTGLARHHAERSVRNVIFLEEYWLHMTNDVYTAATNCLFIRMQTKGVLQMRH